MEVRPAIPTMFDEHGAALYRYARSRLGNDRDAEDVVQEALVRAWRHAHTFDPARGTERAWLFGITRNLIADARRPRRLRIVDLGHTQVEEAGEDPALDRVVEQSLVADVLRTLSGDHRRVLIAAYWEGRTTAEIAQRLDIPQGTVKSRLFYAFRALRLGLEERGVLG